MPNKRHTEQSDNPVVGQWISLMERALEVLTSLLYDDDQEVAGVDGVSKHCPGLAAAVCQG